MNPRVTGEASGCEPPAAATDPRRHRRRQRGLYTQLAGNQQVRLREPALGVARVQRASGRDQEDRHASCCAPAQAQTEEGVVVPRPAGGGR